MTPRVNVVTAAVAIVACLTSSAPAQASNYGFELNGIYRVTSNGDWARTNEVYRNEQTVTQTWTVHSNCANPEECSGAVNSDQGWSAPLRYVDDRWIVDRQILNWEPCPDGTAA